jgi:hypothetical protein
VNFYRVYYFKDVQIFASSERVKTLGFTVFTAENEDHAKKLCQDHYSPFRTTIRKVIKIETAFYLGIRRNYLADGGGLPFIRDYTNIKETLSYHQVFAPLIKNPEWSSPKA